MGGRLHAGSRDAHGMDEGPFKGGREGGGGGVVVAVYPYKPPTAPTPTRYFLPRPCRVMML